MKADFTRDTFAPKKHYDRVLLQQGRVSLDADFNEQATIDAYRLQTATADEIGPSGGPLASAGFELLKPLPPAKGDFRISAGHYYADGILVENESTVPFTGQPWLMNVRPLANDGSYLVYLDVWKRLVSALDDDFIREVALGGPDTAVRSQVIWQVRVVSLGRADAPLCGTPFQAYDQSTRPSTGTLAAKARATQDSQQVCVVPASGGYRRLENQLYRVEIHDTGDTVRGGSDAGKITFKWSRENGSVASWGAFTDDTHIQLSQPGRDTVRGFSGNDWIELLTKENELNLLPGVFVQIVRVVNSVAEIDPTTATSPIKAADYSGSVKVRRWEGGPPIPISTADPVFKDGFLTLEDGVAVQFDQKGLYHNGDYWLIPARTQTGDIIWPITVLLDGSHQPDALPPWGIRHHYARLGYVTVKGGMVTDVVDCRNLFPPLTQLTTLNYVCGDGQEATPDPANPGGLYALGQPLQASVTNGSLPVEGARVRFSVIAGTGQVNGKTSDIVLTTAAGVAQAQWTVRGNEPSPLVEARLLSVDPATGGDITVGAPVRYHINLSTASEVAYQPAACSRLSGAKTVQDALDILCQTQTGGCCVTVGDGGQYPDIQSAWEDLVLKQKKLSICLCLFPGVFDIPGDLKFDPRQPGAGSAVPQIHIQGRGISSRLNWHKGGFTLLNFTSVWFEDLYMIFRDPGAQLSFIACQSIRVERCTIIGRNPGAPLVAVPTGQRVQFIESTITNRPAAPPTPAPTVPAPPPTTAPPGTAPSGGAILFNPLQLVAAGQTARISLPFARQTLASQTEDQFQLTVAAMVRQAQAASPQVLSLQAAQYQALAAASTNADEQASYQSLANVLQQAQLDVNSFAAALAGLYAAATAVSAALALAVLSPAGDLTLLQNRFEGVVCLYGKIPATIDQNAIGQFAAAIATAMGSAAAAGYSGEIRENTFSSLTISQEAVNGLTSGKPDTVPAVYGQVSVTGNRFQDVGNLFLGRALSMQGNFFGSGFVGASFARMAVFTANQSERFGDDSFVSVARKNMDQTIVRQVNLLAILTRP